jgi:hypothetical protein
VEGPRVSAENAAPTLETFGPADLNISDDFRPLV